MAVTNKFGKLSWQEEIRGAFRSLTQLAQFLDCSSILKDDFLKIEKKYPIFIPVTFAQKIKELGPESSLWKQFVPNIEEINNETQSGGQLDPIGDQVNYQNNQIIHRYQNRVLLMTTPICPINCRYCFRKNELLTEEKNKLFEQKFEQALEYLSAHTEIDEVIFTGGDPLMLSNQNLRILFTRLSKISHIKTLRLHSRMPVIIPSRIDKEFIDLFTEFQTQFEHLILAIHINHSEELSEDFESSIKELVLNRIELLSQTVLLKNVNDSSDTLRVLYKNLSRLKIRPYYLHHPDQVLGGMHFTMETQFGKEIYKELRKQLSGWEIPHYVIDHPSGKTIL